MKIKSLLLGSLSLGLIAQAMQMGSAMRSHIPMEGSVPAPSPRKMPSRAKFRKLYRRMQQTARGAAGPGRKETGRYAGWPEGPLNNREAVTHYPRRHHVVDDVEVSGSAEFAKIGGQGIWSGWDEFNDQEAGLDDVSRFATEAGVVGSP